MATLEARQLAQSATWMAPRAGDGNTLGHYLFAVATLSVYGGQVCPYVESLGLLENALLLTALFLGMALLRPRLYLRLVHGRRTRARMLAVAKIDIGLYFSAAIASGVFFSIGFEAPVETTFKLLFGFGFLGVFAALDAALLEERASIERGDAGDADAGFVSLGRTINQFTLAVCLGLVCTILLLVFKDLEWLLSEERQLDDLRAAALIGLEFFVVLAVVLSSSAHVVAQYSRNLRLRMASQVEVLGEVGKGQLGERISDPGNDELKLLSSHINRMLVELEAGHDELADTRDLTIRALSSLAETRDNETGLHIVRTQHYVKILAEQLCSHPDFAAQLQPAYVDLLYKSAPLHDVGKIGIPDHILLKPGKLDDEEFAVMRTHARIGSDALAAASAGGNSQFLALAQEIALYHHEKWDGSGYPERLRGEEIPLSARLMALADVYDALRSKRVYKPAMSHEQAKAIIVDGRGGHFDPRVVDAFLAVEPAFVAIAERYGD